MTDIVERLRSKDCCDLPNCTCDEAADEITTLRAEVSELNSMFDARWSADMRAIERWCKANPGNELVLPDHVDLSLWLMDERTRLTAEVEKLRAYALKAFTVVEFCSGQGFLLQYPSYDCDDLLMEGVDLLKVETSEEARAVLSASQPAQEAPAP